MRQFTLKKSHISNNTLYDLVEEKLTDGSYAHAIRVTDTDDDHSIVIDFPDEVTAIIIFNGLVTYTL